MDSPGAGGLRRRLRQGGPVLFAIVGILLAVGGVAVPAYGTLLFAWAGTALFVSLLLAVVVSTPTVPAFVATALQETLAHNANRVVDAGTQEYIPRNGSVVLVVGETTLDAVGKGLLASIDTPELGTTAEDALPVLVDIVVADLELAAEATPNWTDSGVEVTVTDSRIDTESLFDHPVGSVLGVGLAQVLDKPVRVDATAEEETVVFAFAWD